jgi:hypothetical protein
MYEWWIIQLSVGLVFFLVLISIRRQGEGFAHAIRRVIIVEVAYLGVAYLLGHLGRSNLQSLLGGLVAALIVNQLIPGRSRQVSRPLATR